MRYILPFLFSLSLVPHISYAQDNSGLKRLTLRSDLLGFEAIGRLDMPGGYCTGVLIARDLVLTAAHCLSDAVKNGSLDGMQFRAGLRDGKHVAASAAKLAVMHPSYDDPSNSRFDQVAKDVGLVVLEDPISTGVAAPFAVQQLQPGQDALSVVSYASGRDEALSRQAECSVVVRNAELVVFDCNVTFGSSGAPVFDTSGRRPRIVSLVSGGMIFDGEKVAIGMHLPARLAEVKQALRAGRGVVGGTEVKSRQIGIGERNNTGARFVKP